MREGRATVLSQSRTYAHEEVGARAAIGKRHGPVDAEHSEPQTNARISHEISETATVEYLRLVGFAPGAARIDESDPPNVREHSEVAPELAHDPRECAEVRLIFELHER